MTKRETDDAMLNELFDAARADTPEPSSDMMARILADAGHVLEDAALAAKRLEAARRPRRGDIFEMVGGWLGLGGLSGAAALGLLLGLSPIPGLSDAFDVFYPSAAIELGTMDETYEALLSLEDA